LNSIGEETTKGMVHIDASIVWLVGGVHITIGWISLDTWLGVE
jgi:hypothetical protein